MLDASINDVTTDARGVSIADDFVATYVVFAVHGVIASDDAHVHVSADDGGLIHGVLY